ncbi:carbamoyltransferase [bacterium]|nr:carbamoyltransferase [bacterium]
MYILGISCFYHDSAAALIKDGKIIAAAQEERFSRKKHDARFPVNAVNYCLKEAKINIKDIDYVSFYDKPFIKFERILETYLAYAPNGIASFTKAIPLWLKEKLWIPDLIKNELDGYDGKIIFPEHHESHAASAFYASPFDEAAFATLDGVGEWTTSSWGVGKGKELDIWAEIKFPHSIGLLYSAFTYYTGFKVNSGEYKVMGLAPYGESKYTKLIFDNIIDLKEDGSFKLDMTYFNYCAGLTMTSEKFHNLFGGPPRESESTLTQKEMDLAKSVQDVTEEVMMRISRHIRKETGMKNLTLAGGVALNCVGNGKILREKIFDKIWIQPAAGDAGGALGCALYTWHKYLGNERKADNTKDFQYGSYLGPRFSDFEIETFLKSKNIPFTKMEESKKAETVAEILATENVVGWFSGRMEFGPRALGGRSIIGDSRSPKMQEIMNLKIKFRESFRPFAPSVLGDKVDDFFEIENLEPYHTSPYMLLVADVKKELQREMTAEQNKLFGIEKLNIIRSTMPAITHVDYSARIQTVHQETNPEYYNLINKFYEKTGCAVIINTSFNVRGEPIVCTPEDAFRCFMRTNMDYLVLENYLIDKKKQKDLESDSDWKKEFELD